MEKRKEQGFFRFCSNGLYLIACAVCIGLLLLNIVYRVQVSQEEVATIQVSLLRSAGILILTGLAVLLLALAGDKIQVSEQKCFLVWTLIYTVMALYLVLNVDTRLRDDALAVRSAAVKVLNGDYDPFAKGGYIRMYPHQLGLMLYDMLVYRFSENRITPFLANFALVLGIQYLIWRIADTVFHSPSVNLVTMGLSFGFLPQFFYILFVYGTIPGLFFILLAFYNGLRYAKEGSPGRLLAAALSGGIAVILRKNYIIGVAALAIFLFLRALESEKKGRFAGAICLILVCAVVPNRLLLNAVEAKTGCDLHNGVPNSLFIAMGTDLSNDHFRGPGWYNQYNRNTYLEMDEDGKAAEAVGWQKVADNWNAIREEPVRALRFFAKKVVTTWCDPEFQSVWSGPLERRGQYAHTPLLKSIYRGGIAERLLNLVCKCVVLPIWLFAAGYLPAFHKKNRDWELFYLFLIGGMLFHFVWETKSQYVYPYLFCLIPFAAYALVQAVRWMRKRLPQR